jgi:hypothetical protein
MSAVSSINDVQQSIEQVQKELKEERKRNELLGIRRKKMTNHTYIAAVVITSISISTIIQSKVQFQILRHEIISRYNLFMVYTSSVKFDWKFLQLTSIEQNSSISYLHSPIKYVP